MLLRVPALFGRPTIGCIFGIFDGQETGVDNLGPLTDLGLLTHTVMPPRGPRCVTPFREADQDASRGVPDVADGLAGGEIKSRGERPGHIGYATRDGPARVRSSVPRRSVSSATAGITAFPKSREILVQ